MLCVITDFMGDDTTLELELLGSNGIEVFVASDPGPAAWASTAIGADAILTRHAPIGAATIATLDRCRIIARYGTGHDNIDAAAAQAKGIAVTAVVDYATPEVADHTMALVLALARALPVHGASVAGGDWTPQPLPPMRRLAGLTLGLLGCGRIGAAVAQRAAAFGMEVVAFDPYASSTPPGTTRVDTLESLLGHSDVLSLHAPLTPATEGIIGAPQLELLPDGAFVVNVARGRLLDLDAAMAFVDSGRLGGLGLDVTPEEPLPADHPARRHPRVVLTPHVGYYSTASVIEAKRRSVAEILRVLGGQPPLHPVVVAPQATPDPEAP